MTFVISYARLMASTSGLKVDVSVSKILIQINELMPTSLIVFVLFHAAGFYFGCNLKNICPNF